MILNSAKVNGFELLGGAELYSNKHKSVSTIVLLRLYPGYSKYGSIAKTLSVSNISISWLSGAIALSKSLM